MISRPHMYKPPNGGAVADSKNYPFCIAGPCGSTHEVQVTTPSDTSSPQVTGTVTINCSEAETEVGSEGIGCVVGGLDLRGLSGEHVIIIATTGDDGKVVKTVGGTVTINPVSFANRVTVAQQRMNTTGGCGCSGQ